MWRWMSGRSDALPAIRKVSDHLWVQIHPVTSEIDTARSTGRRRADLGRIQNGSIIRTRSGLLWNLPPWELGYDSTRSILVDARGGSLSLEVAGANGHVTKLLAMTLDGEVAERPRTEIRHLCLHKGYENLPCHQVMSGTRNT